MRILHIIIITFINFGCSSNNRISIDITVPNGLETSEYKYGPGDVVYKGYLDKSGTIWFTTSQEGVYRYDGKSFYNYNTLNGLCGNEISTITEDSYGNFWFGTENGLCKFDGENFETIPLPDYSKKSEWLDKYYPMINPKAVSCILQDRKGILWVGSNCAGLYKYDGKKFTSYLQEKGNLMPDSMYHNFISSIVEDNKGHIWIGSFSHGGINQFDGNEFIHYSLDDGIGDGMISSIYIDRQQNIWVGTRNTGIHKYENKSFVSFQKNESNKKIPMAKFFEDSNGTLWVSSYARKGVYQINGEKIKPFNIFNSDKLVDVMSISEDNYGNIWFGGRYGLLWRYNGIELKDFTYKKRKFKTTKIEPKK